MKTHDLHLGDVGVGCYGVSFIVIYELILCCFFFGWFKAKACEVTMSSWKKHHNWISGFSLKWSSRWGNIWNHGRWRSFVKKTTQCVFGGSTFLGGTRSVWKDMQYLWTSQNETKQQIIFSKSNLWQLMASKWMAPKLRVAVWDSSILSSLSG